MQNIPFLPQDAAGPLMAAPQPADPPSASALPESAQPGSHAARIGMWVMVLGLGGLLLWAAFAPLDEGVPTPGMVVIDTKRRAVQHLTGGMVKEVLVGEGDLVKEGQTLIRLDPAAAQASYEAIRQRYLGLRAAQGRLLAERRGGGGIEPHPDLREALSDPLIRSQLQTQAQLLQARRLALQADVQVLGESVDGQAGLIQAYGEMQVSRRQQLASLMEELKNTRAMVEEGYVARNRQLELERMVAESSAGLAELAGNVARARHSVAELRQRVLARQQEFRKNVEGELAEVNREAQSDAGKYAAARDDLSRIDIKSPASGQVVGLAVQSVGAVVQAGQKLMDVVPEGEPLLLEAHIAPHLVDRVRVGLPTDVRFSGFAHSPQLVVEGEVQSISKDILVDQANGAPYYLARIAVLPAGRKSLGARVLQPGMPAEVVIRTGERSVLGYLLGPLAKRLASSMKEE